MRVNEMYRKVEKILESKPTVEGAGVNLKRAFGHNEVPLLDPFLLLDDFHSDNPDDYIAGFPWHPHRGMETVTYMLRGTVEHQDSLGNKGVIRSGDVQWMTAGSGIIHQEMPIEGEGELWGFQLWVNLPSNRKMMDPRYQEFKKEEIPKVLTEKGVKIRIISGEVKGKKGPVRDIVVDPEYLDISMNPDMDFEHIVKKGYKVFAYVIEGNGYFDPDKEKLIERENLVVFGEGDVVKITTGDKDVRFLLVSGKPLGEPGAWNGPIVMNTKQELETAFKEYQNGTFIKNK